MRLGRVVLSGMEGIVLECLLYEVLALLGDLVAFVFLEFICHLSLHLPMRPLDGLISSYR
jgi:hypothetical protein